MYKKEIVIVICIFIFLLGFLSYTGAFNFDISNNVGINLATIDSVYANSTSPMNFSSFDLTCFATAISDGENVDYNGFWYKDGVQQFYEWNQTIDAENANDGGYDVAVDSNNNIIVAGYNYIAPAYGQLFDFWILKYNVSGNLQWSTKFGQEGYDISYGVAVDSQDNIIIVGTYNDELSVVKFNNSGDLLWNKTIGGGYTPVFGETNKPVDIAIDLNSNIIVTGTNNSKMWLIKLNASGTNLWNVSEGSGARDQEETGQDVTVDSENNIIVTGKTNSYGAGGYDIWVIKYNSDGAYLWNNTFGTNKQEQGRGIAVDSNDNIFVTGFTSSYGAGNNDTIVIKYNSSGSQVWYSLAGTTNNEEGETIIIDSQGEIFVSGRNNINTGTDIGTIFTFKLNSSGNQVWNNTFDDSSYNNPRGQGVVVDSNDNLIITGRTGSYGSLSVSDIFLVKYYGFNLSNQIQGNQILIKTLDNSYTSAGDNWTCQIRAYNGTNYTSYTESSSLNIKNENCGTYTCYCGSSVNSNLNLDQNLDCTNNALNISNSNIIIDCQGYQISGNTAGIGFNSTDQHNLTIRNCNISGFENGILISNSSHNNITNNSLVNNIVAIYISPSENNSISKNEFYFNDDVIILVSSNTSNVGSNNFHNNSLLVINISSDSYNNTFNNNTFCYNYFRIPVYNTTNNINITNSTFCIFPLNPTNSTYLASLTYNFNINATNSLYKTSTNCSLYINDIIKASNKSLVINNKKTSLLAQLGSSDGNYNWSVNCTDDYNNTATSGIYWFSVDRTNPNPTLSISNSVIALYGSNIITCSGTDNFDSSPTTSLSILKPNNELFINPNMPFTDTGISGTYSLTCQIIDDAGNSATTTSTFQVNNYPGSIAGSNGGSGDNSGLLSKTTTQKIIPLASGSGKIIVNVGNQEISVYQINIDHSSTIENAKIKIDIGQTENIDNKEVYQINTITSENFEQSQINQAQAFFKINRSWIVKNNISIDSISLYQKNSPWRPLETEYVKSDMKYYYFKSNLKELNPVAVVGEIIQPEKITITEESYHITIPPIIKKLKIPIIISIIILLLLTSYRFIYQNKK